MIARCFNVLLFDFVTMGITIENFIKRFLACASFMKIRLSTIQEIRCYQLINFMNKASGHGSCLTWE